MMSKRCFEKDVGNENEGVEEEKDEVNDLFTQLCGECSKSFTRKNNMKNNKELVHKGKHLQ